MAFRRSSVRSRSAPPIFAGQPPQLGLEPALVRRLDPLERPAQHGCRLGVVPGAREGLPEERGQVGTQEHDAAGPENLHRVAGPLDGLRPAALFANTDALKGFGEGRKERELVAVGEGP